MSTTRWHEVDRLFHLAVERQGHEREIFLEAACGADMELWREVESLLRADAGPVSLLDRAVDLRDSTSRCSPPRSSTRPTCGWPAMVISCGRAAPISYPSPHR